VHQVDAADGEPTPLAAIGLLGLRDTASWALTSVRRAPPKKTRPTSVSSTRLEFLFNSFRPSSFSRSATCWLSAAADTDKRRAALRKLSASATATK